MKTANPVIAYGLILLAVAWMLAALITSIRFEQKSILLLSSLAILALLCAVSGIIVAARLQPRIGTYRGATPRNDARISSWIQLAGLCGYLLPLSNLLLPFWLWKSQRKTSRFIDQSGVHALNFQLTCAVYFLGALMLVPLLAGFVILPAVIVYHVLFTLRATLVTRKHKPYHYPGNLSFITENRLKTATSN